ncbi:MAG: LPP20 family lipoprotein [Desulfonauticus sp.]|nr:LPP20 family lipoprotein [Desulfonauticus sp.]
MRKTLGIFLVSWILGLLISAGAMAQSSGDYVQKFANGQIDWTTGVVTAKGIGAPPATAVNMAQARAMAVRAATVVARRNLLEVIKGVQIDSTTTVQNYMVTNDIIVSRVNGFLQNSQVLDISYMSDGSVEVTVGVNLRGGLANILIPPTIQFGTKMQKPSELLPQKPAVSTPSVPTTPEISTPQPPTVPQAETQPKPQVVYTGLIIDARGLSARPAMSPKVYDENGQEVYGSAFVSREYAIQQGMAGYAKDLEKAKMNPRVANNPFIVKAIQVKGRARTDLVISNKVANELRALSKNQNFLEKCRVMIILD